MEYKQQELDLRLDYERSLKDNLINVANFTETQMKEHAEEDGRPLKTVESKQEAYGITAQTYVQVCQKQKTLKGEMDDFLKLLDADGEATQVAGTIYNAALELAQSAVTMAAQASRILADLYYATPKTPLEEFMDAEETEDEADAEEGDE
jgi:hypothetical protein